MREADYVKASNVGKLAVALSAIQDVVAGHAEEYGVTFEERAAAYRVVEQALATARLRCSLADEAARAVEQALATARKVGADGNPGGGL